MPPAPRPRELLGTLAAAGVLDLFIACGPVAPSITSGDGSDTGNNDDDTSDPPTTGAPDPTAPDPTAPDPTATDPTVPPPECNDSNDCSELYCGYCDQGTCREGGGCCGLAGITRPDMQRFRCGQSYECYDDSECGEGEECEFGECTPAVTTTLPACDAPDFILQQWNLGASPGAFLLADLDLDGDLDLAAAQPSVAQIQIALNDGAGGFTLAGAFGVGAPLEALSIVTGDFDDDLDDDDLAVLRRDPAGGLILLFGQDAVFTPQPALPTAPSPINLLRGPAGLVLISPGEVRIRPSPFFTEEVPALVANLDHRANLADLDMETGTDLVGPLTDQPTVVGAWLLGDGHEYISLAFVDPHVEHALVLAGDLDQNMVPIEDDHRSLILARTIDDHGEIEVWTGIDTPPRLAPPIRFTTSAPITGGIGFDLDAPQGLDILATTGQASVLRVLGDAVGGFMCQHLVPLPAPTTPSLLVAGDLNNDAHIDLVVGDPASGTVSVLMAP